jgi:hypothetical protein
MFRAPAETDRQLPSVCRVRPSLEAHSHSWLRAEVDGSDVVVRFRSHLGRAPNRPLPTATSEVTIREPRARSGVGVVSSASAQVSGDRRKVVAGRQLSTRSCVGKGGLRVAGVVRDSR